MTPKAKDPSARFAEVAQFIAPDSTSMAHANTERLGPEFKTAPAAKSSLVLQHNRVHNRPPLAGSRGRN